MKNHNPSMCKGLQQVKYNGPEIIATLTVANTLETPLGRVAKKRTIEVRARLNNPRKSEQAVLTEICAKVKAEHPSAKLVSFKTKKGKS